MNRLPEAEAVVRPSMDLRRRAEKPGYAYALASLQIGNVIAREGRLAEADGLDREEPRLAPQLR